MRPTVIIGLLCGLGSCRIYTPLQPPVPDIQAKGQGETSIGGRMGCHLEAAAAYSPLNHLLVRAAGGSLRGSTIPDARFRAWQYEASLGGYGLLGRRWQGGGFVGLGRGRTRWDNLNSVTAYDVRFLRPFGEAYVRRYLGPGTSVGVVYRLNYLRFTTFTDAGGPTGVRSVVRHEPLLFARFNATPESGVGFLAVQISTGLTLPQNLRLSQTNDYTEEAVFQTDAPMLYSTLSLIIRPHYFRDSARRRTW